MTICGIFGGTFSATINNCLCLHCVSFDTHFVLNKQYTNPLKCIQELMNRHREKER